MGFSTVINAFISGKYKYSISEFCNVRIASFSVSTRGSPPRLNEVLNRIGIPVLSLNALIRL